MTVQKLNRVSEFTNINPFHDLEADEKTFDQLVDVELVIAEIAEVTFTGEDGEAISGVAFYGHLEDSGESFKTLGFSKVVHDQLTRIPLDAFPIAGVISRKGKGNRKYYTIS